MCALANQYAYIAAGCRASVSERASEPASERPCGVEGGFDAVERGRDGEELRTKREDGWMKR